jgi:DNA modification methylase
VAKLKPLGNLNLFEPVAETKAPSISSPPQEKKIKDACPKCGGRSLKTVRAFEHEGKTHYCASGCLSNDRMDSFYFTPVAEPFDEQAEREEAKKLFAQEEAAAIKSQIESVEMERPEEDGPTSEQIENSILGQPIDLFGNPIEKDRSGALAERFIVPPFSVLDARQGYWTKRKAEWIQMGITSEDGRTGSMASYRADKLANVEMAIEPVRPKGVLYTGNEVREWGTEYDGGVAWSGATSSIFDPVLCELAYRWFAPDKGKLLDPFAGGSVRGIVAEKLGYRYTGIELRQEQIDANKVQAEKIGVQPNWICGDSSQMDKLVPVPAYDEMFDMVFTCPPYYDLEEYSESAADGSAKQTYTEFLIWYKEIFRQCKERLKWNRFLVIVVGEIRDENGFYRNFVGDTITTMLSLGLRYYNEAILVTAVGSLPLRVNGQFGGYRKLGKTHQNVLVFYNGSNCDQISEKFGKLL